MLLALERVNSGNSNNRYFDDSGVNVHFEVYINGQQYIIKTNWAEYVARRVQQTSIMTSIQCVGIEEARALFSHFTHGYTYYTGTGCVQALQGRLLTRTWLEGRYMYTLIYDPHNNKLVFNHTHTMPPR
jgi:hypothetical protein